MEEMKKIDELIKQIIFDGPTPQFDMEDVIATSRDLWLGLLRGADVLSLAICNSCIFSVLGPIVSLPISVYLYKFLPFIIIDFQHT